MMIKRYMENLKNIFFNPVEDSHDNKIYYICNQFNFTYPVQDEWPNSNVCTHLSVSTHSPIKNIYITVRTKTWVEGNEDQYYGTKLCKKEIGCFNMI